LRARGPGRDNQENEQRSAEHGGGFKENGDGNRRQPL
jgi:hypothetical protein